MSRPDDPPLAVRAEALSVLRESALYWSENREVVASAAADYRAWTLEKKRQMRAKKRSLPHLKV